MAKTNPREKEIARSKFFKEFKILHQGVDNLNAKYGLVNEKLEHLDGKFENLSGKFDSYHEEFRILSGKYDKLTTKVFVNIEKTLENIIENMMTKEAGYKMSLKILKLESRMDDFQKTVMTKEDGQKIIDHIDAFAQRSEDHDNKVLFHDHRLKELEAKSENHETRITRLETDNP